MKTKNLTEDYLHRLIVSLTKEIIQCKFRIARYEMLIKKEKEKLPNTNISHSELWWLRDRLRRNVQMIKDYRRELKSYQKMYDEKHNPQTANVK